jgi:hypothetical protein
MSEAIRQSEENLDEIIDDEDNGNGDQDGVSTVRYTTRATIQDEDRNSSSYVPHKPYDRNEAILKKRAVFKWLPVYCSNDIVHGSW